jgi:hypothetical protein
MLLIVNNDAGFMLISGCNEFVDTDSRKRSGFNEFVDTAKPL